MSLPMTVTKHEAVPLQNGRRNELLEELAKTLSDRDRLTLHNAEIQKKAKEIIKSRELRIKELTEQLAVNSETIPRECLIEYDFNANTVRLKDAKTRELVDERAMTPQERAELVDERDAQPTYPR